MKTTPLLLASNFAPVVDTLRAALPPSLLLIGETGVGLSTIARSLSPHIEQVIAPQNAKGEPDHIAGSIGIEVIRSLYDITRGKARHSYTVIIDDADRMTIPAQQAFLKLLEEPPAATHFVLTSHAPEKLLSTIRSRVTTYNVPRISRLQSEHYLNSQSIDAETVKQLLFIAEGRAAKLHDLVANPRSREQAAELIRDARTFISGSSFERFVIANTYTDRSKALNLLDASLSLLRFAMSKQPSNEITRQIESLIATAEAITNGGNVKLQLIRSVL